MYSECSHDTQKQPLADILQKKLFLKILQYHKKHLCRSIFLIKGLKVCERLQDVFLCQNCENLIDLFL